MRSTTCTALLACLALAGCGGGTKLITGKQTVVTVQAPAAIADLNIPVTATKNTTRVAGATPVADAAGVALAVYPPPHRGPTQGPSSSRQPTIGRPPSRRPC